VTGRPRMRPATKDGKNAVVVDPSTARATVSQLINRDTVIDAVPRDVCAHPWFSSQRRTSRATVRRLGVLLAPPQFYDVIPPNDAPDVVSPLYAQPVLETLLRIPLYRLFEGGRDRGLARRAFENDVPEPILDAIVEGPSAGISRAACLYKSFRSA
jgi:hypothetical protein